MGKTEDSRTGEESSAAEPEVRTEQADTAEQAAEAGSEMSLQEALERLTVAETESREARDKLLRVQAEMQNLRRRTEQDIEKAHRFGQEKFSGELLMVMDNLERAAEAAGKHDDGEAGNQVIKAIHEGVNLTLKSLVDCFARFQIEAVDPEGEPFDPTLHQAMSIQENDKVEPNTVISVMQKGYTLHGRVLRPAMVVVATEAAAKSGD